MDSLEIVELIMELEAETGIDIADENLTNIETVEDAIRFIEERRSDREDG
jgi:acyl carrier protein